MENLYHQEVKRLKAENDLLRRQLIAIKFRNELNAFAKCFYRDRLREIEISKNKKVMTTQEAADFLNVSRPYLIGLLDNSEISFFMVGSHRRIFYSDVESYKNFLIDRSVNAAKELSKLSQEMDNKDA